jgi:hypothetical protein
MKTIVESLKFN